MESEAVDLEENKRVSSKQREARRRARRRAKQRKRIFSEVREWIVSLAIALLVVIVLRSFVFTLIRVDGESMQPTLMDGERLLVTVHDGRFGEIKRGDVVICHYPNREGDNFVKRVVGVPGDSVYRERSVTHVVYSAMTAHGPVIRDEELDPNYSLRPLRQGPDYEPYMLGENEYFVVGDNRYYSHDSRDWNDGDPSFDVGPITRDMIIGRVRYVVWPPDDIRTVQ